MAVGISTLFCSVARRRSETIFTLSKMSFIINSWTVGCVDGFGKTALWNEAYSIEKSAVLWDVTPCKRLLLPLSLIGFVMKLVGSYEMSVRFLPEYLVLLPRRWQSS
jgi:hypothetical protein